jgi:hypothetical protein
MHVMNVQVPASDMGDTLLSRMLSLLNQTIRGSTFRDQTLSSVTSKQWRKLLRKSVGLLGGKDFSIIESDKN